MPNLIDWPAIRAKYATGIPQASLAREYGVTQQAISKRALKEGWVVEHVVPPTTDSQPAQPAKHDPQNILNIIAVLLEKVAQHADQQNIEPKDIKLLADAISQFHKIRLTSPENTSSESGLPSDLLRFLTADELSQVSTWQSHIEAMLEVARERKLESEGIKTVHRKVG